MSNRQQRRQTNKQHKRHRRMVRKQARVQKQKNNLRNLNPYIRGIEDEAGRQVFPDSLEVGYVRTPFLWFVHQWFTLGSVLHPKFNFDVYDFQYNHYWYELDNGDLFIQLEQFDCMGLSIEVDLIVDLAGDTPNEAKKRISHMMMEALRIHTEWVQKGKPDAPPVVIYNAT